MKQTSSARNRSRFLMPATFLVLLIGLAAAWYLTDLFIRVHNPEGESVESFCAISEGINCVTVANSQYATVLGIPISLYGMEYYLLGLFVLVMGAFGAAGFSRWDSLIFWMGIFTIPVTLTLFALSTFLIESVCLMCCVLYLVNLSLILLPAVAGRGGPGGLFTAGPRELFSGLMRSKAALAAVAVLILIALTQFAWAPGLFPANNTEVTAKGSWKGLPVDGLSLGDPESPIRIEEFTDFQCPFCAKAHFVIMQVIEKYPGKIYHVHRDMPLDQACNPYINRPFHPDACNAALAARCAARQGKFREIEELLFSHNRNLKPGDLVKYVLQVGVDAQRYDACVKSPETMKGILADIDEAKKRGVTGTPGFFVNGEQVKGYRPIEFWDKKIQEILAGQP